MRSRRSLSGLIEGRLFVEERRPLKIIPDAFGENPVLKLMFGAMVRAAERRRALAGDQGDRLRAPTEGGRRSRARSRTRGPTRPRATANTGNTGISLCSG